jgi:hypothetical protein
MRPLVLCTLALCALSACDLVGKPKQRPEEFALGAVRALTMNDWGAYVPLCSRAATRAAAGGAGAVGDRLSGFELEQKRAEFDRIVRSRRLREHAIDVYQTVVVAQEPQRWTVHVQDANGNPVGVELVIGRLGERYEVITVNLR